MNITLQKFIPGENVRMMIIATCIGLMTGVSIILFRSVVEGVEMIFFAGGKKLLGIHLGVGTCCSCP